MGDIIKIVKSLEDSGLLIKGVGKIIKNEISSFRFLGILLDRLGISLLGYMLAGKGALRAGRFN